MNFCRALLTIAILVGILKTMDEEESLVNFKNCVLASMLYFIWRY